MQYRHDRRHRHQVSTIGFGVWTVGTTWWGVKDRAVGHRPAATRLRPRLTFFDTADTYTSGDAEVILHEALGDKRDQIVIGTKFGYDIYNHPESPGQQERPHDWSPAYMRKALGELAAPSGHGPHRPLSAAQPAHRCHRNDDLWAELQKAQDEGLIRAVGVALGPAFDLRQTEEGRRSRSGSEARRRRSSTTCSSRASARGIFPDTPDEQRRVSPDARAARLGPARRHRAPRHASSSRATTATGA